MFRRSLVVAILMGTTALAGCGSKTVPQPQSIDDMRDLIAIAIENGDEAQVKQLVERQPLLLVEPIPNLQNRTVLHCAALADNAALVQYLLEQGADPYIQDDDALYPVDVAIEHGASQAVIDLLQIQ